MKCAGFTFLELMIVLALGSLMTGLVVTIMRQTMMTTTIVNTALDNSWRSIICYERLWQDIAGCCLVPYLAPEKSAAAEQEKKEAADKEAAVPLPTSKQEPSKLPPLALTTGAGGITKITCVTNNPLRVYNKEQPLLVIIEYELVADKERPSLFTLQRAQKIMGDKNAGRAYPLLTRVSQLGGTVFYRTIQKEGAAKKTPTIAQAATWPLPSEKGVEIPPLPVRLLLQIKFLDESADEQELVIDIPIFAAYGDPSLQAMQPAAKPVPIPAHAKTEKRQLVTSLLGELQGAKPGAIR